MSRLCSQAIDISTYTSLRDELRENLALAEMAARDARIDELDVEAILAASDQILNDAARLWDRASVEQRRRLQAAIFPKGKPSVPRRKVWNRRNVYSFQ